MAASNKEQQQSHQHQPVIRQDQRKPIRKSSTSILCELTRLKSQQKYLECNQVKLNPNNFLDGDDAVDGAISRSYCSPNKTKYNNSNEINGTVDDDDDEDVVASANKNTKKCEQTVTNLINEVEYLKVNLNEKLQAHRADKHNELKDMWHYINAMKTDVFCRPERLNQLSMQSLRDRIIGINKQLERLTAKNANELRQLQDEYEAMEKDNKIILI